LIFFYDFRYVSDLSALGLASWSILTNVAVMVFYLCLKREHKKFIPNFVFFTQAAVGFIVATYALLSTLPNYYKAQWMNERYYNIARIVLEDYSIFFALGVLVIGAGERSLAVYKPFLHFRVISLSKAMLFVLVVCMLAFIPCAVLMFYTKPEGHIEKQEFYVIYGSFRVGFIFLGIFITLIVLLLSYCRVQKSVRDAASRADLTKRTNSITRRLRSSEENEIDGESKKELRSVTILILLTMVYALTYLPLGVFSVVRSVAAEWLSFFEMLIVEIAVFLLYILSAAINPLLILFLQYDFRLVFCKHCCCCCCCCPNGKKKNEDEKDEVIVEMLSNRSIPEDVYNTMTPRTKRAHKAWRKGVN